MKTIYVVFTRNNTWNAGAKEYAFLCPYTEVVVGSRITSPNYDSPMIVTRITHCSDCFQHGMALKHIVINTINSQRFIGQSASRTVSITIEQAREWYLGNNSALKALALNAYSKSELVLDFSYILRNTNHCTHTFPVPVDSVLRNITYHKLEVIAKHFNGNWKKTTDNKGYFIGKTNSENRGFIVSEGRYAKIMEHNTVAYAGIIYFKSRIDAEKALEILGTDINNLF